MQVHVYHPDAEDLKTVLYRTCTARPERTHVWGMLPSLLDEAWINNDGIATLTLLEGESTQPHVHLKPVHAALCRLPIALLATIAIASHLREIASPWDEHQKKSISMTFVWILLFNFAPSSALNAALQSSSYIG